MCAVSLLAVPHPEQITEAVCVWLGWRLTAWPQRDEQRLVSHFGDDEAVALLPLVRRWEDDFYRWDAAESGPDLASMGATAAADCRRLHPEATEEAAEALAWAYTVDHK
jgi:hypothetical protein